MKKRIMIIDDELQRRRKNYENVLIERYDVEYSDNVDLIYEQIKKSKVDLYIIDLNLDKFIDPKTKRGMNVKDILEAVGKNKPIILLSGTYPELAKDGRLQAIITKAAEEEYNVCSFLAYDEIRRLDSENTAIEKEQLDGYKEALYSNIDICIKRDKSPCDFGVVCALDEELQPFLDLVQSNLMDSINIDGISYKRGVLSTKNGKELEFLCTVSTNMGIADASILATHMASHFGVRNIFMIGVCGGRETVNVNIGDVITPLESTAFQRGKLTEKGFSAEVENAKHKEHGNINDDTANEVLFELYTIYLKKDKEIKKLPPPKRLSYVMACADYVIDKKGVLDIIAKKISRRKLCAVDMESYAIYRVGELLDVNTLVIKSVMDLTNNKSDKYKQYAAFMAANYLYQLLYREELTLNK